MTNEEKLDNSSFFESVAHHNLERFHSETIAWIFNANTDITLNFIKNILGEKEEIINFKVKAEISDIDIFIFYKTIRGNYFTHIENKVKADEHFILVDNKSDILDKHKKENNKYLSQSEYYYLREKGTISHKIKEVLEIKDDFDIKDIEWKYVFLLPTLSTEEKKHNSWTIKNSESIAIENPWKNISYCDILNCIPETKIGSILTDYRNFLIKKFTSNGVSELVNFDIKSRIIINDKTLSDKNINVVLSNKATIFEEHGIKLHFFKLRDNLIDFCKMNFNKFNFNVRFITDTGNNKSFLIDICVEQELENPSEDIFAKDKIVKIRTGLQFEKNSIKNGKFKYYLADVEYKSGLILNKEKYKENAQKILISIFEKNYLRENSHININGELKFNGSKNKSFCSFSKEFEFDNFTVIENRFKNEIRYLANSLDIKPFKEQISLLADK